MNLIIGVKLFEFKETIKYNNNIININLLKTSQEILKLRNIKIKKY
jgi:hypothetical protein